MSIYVNANSDSTLKDNTLPRNTKESAGKNYFGNYLGVVIQNNDPEKGGKVKVWVPEVSPSIYKNWDDNNLNKQFIDFNVMDKPYSSICDYGECGHHCLYELNLIR